MHALRHVAQLNYLRRLLPNSPLRPLPSPLRSPSGVAASQVHWQSTDATSSHYGAAQGIQLRPYQEESINAVLEYLGQGERRLGISLATGSGKTVIFSHLIDRVKPPNQDAVQTLIIAHRQELVDQAASHCRRLYPNKTVDVEMSARQGSGHADITVASVGSLNAGDRLLKYDPASFKLIIVDECHHIVAPTYLNVLRHFNLVDSEKTSDTALVGVSATMSRSDGLSLGKALDHIVYHKDYLDMIEEEWLAGLIFTTVRLELDLSDVKGGRGDFQTGSLSKAVNTDELNAVAVRAWFEKASSRKSTLVFCVDLSHVTALTAMFRQHGVEAKFITGETDSQARRERLDAFKAGEYPVLLNCGIFTEGTDIPNIDCILLARPTRSRNLLIQMIGRGLRKHASKENCHVIDLVSALDTGIVTTPTLFGLDPDTLVEAADAAAMKEMQDSQQKEVDDGEQAPSPTGSIPPLPGEIIFTDYKDVHDLIEDTSGERGIRAISRFAWVQVDDNKYILSTTLAELTVTKEGDQFVVSSKRRLQEGTSKKPWMRPRTIARATTFEQAVRAADTFAKTSFVVRLIAKNAPWRNTPASEGQIKFLNGFRGDDQKLEPEFITKGKAGDWITKIKHGAQGRFDRLAAVKRKGERVEQKGKRYSQAQSRAQVSVGPVAK